MSVHLPSLHAWPEGQAPQLMVLLQPSPCMPQVKPCDAQVCAGQVFMHVPVRHDWPEGQAPQSMTALQPLSCMPQVKPCDAQVFGVQIVGGRGPTHEPRSKIMNSSIFSC